MARRALEFEVLKGNSRKAVFEAEADPDNVAGLRRELTDWLEDDGWDPKLWGKFRMVVREAGRMRPLKEVRA